MIFDPAQPYQVLPTPKAAGFDPTKPFTTLQGGVRERTPNVSRGTSVPPEGPVEAPKLDNTPLQPIFPTSDPNQTTDWSTLYSGLEGLDDRVTPEQKQAFTRLDAVTKEPQEARARTINQAYWATKLKGMTRDGIAANWPTVKKTILEKQFHLQDMEMTDAAFYARTADHIKQTQFLFTPEFRDANPAQKFHMIVDNVLGHAGQAAEDTAHQASLATKPFKELPTAPQFPEMPGMGMYQPALVAGVYNSVVKPLVEGVESPLGVVTLGAGGELAAGAKLGKTGAAAGLKWMQGIFSAIMAKNALQTAPRAVQVMNDPNATLQEKIEAVGEPVGDSVMAITAAWGAVHEATPKVAKDIQAKPVLEQIATLKEEAAHATIPEAEHMNVLAQELGKVAPEPPTEANKAWDEVKKVFAPAARGEQAEVAAGALREHGAELAQRTDRAAAALEGASKALMKMDAPERWEAVDRIENGQDFDPANPALADLKDFATTTRQILDTKREEIQKLGTGKLEHFIEDYFPHIWKDPEKAADTFAKAQGAKAPLEGSKSFLKKRSIPTIKEGMALGLEPVTTNPVEMVLLKAREMDKYILGQKWLAEMKERGFVKFVPAMEKAPEGYHPINDSIAKVYGPPTIHIPEQVDTATLKALTTVMDNLGIKHERLAGLSRRKGMKSDPLGLSYTGKSKIQTKGGTPLSVMAHEIGHQLDEKFGLGKIINSPELASELVALADLHGYKPEYFGKPEELTASAVEAWVGAKELFKKTTPKTYKAMADFLDQHPVLKPLQDLVPGIGTTELGFEKPHGGLLKMGEYMAPDNVATVANNYLSPGLRKHASFRAYLTAANSLNQFQLGLSAFHLSFTSIDASISKLALALEYGEQGKLGKAAAKVAQIPVAPVSNMLQGNRVLKEWMRPGSQGEEFAQIVDAIRQGGGRAKMDNFYQTSITKRMTEMFKEGRVSGYWGALWRAPFAAMETASKPIMEYIVPRQKLGVAADLIRMENERLPVNATLEEKRAAYAKVWDSVDNRMGQMVYDNLFWNKVAKDMAMASVRSVGWNLGTLRELGGGIMDTGKFAKDVVTAGERAEFSHRMAYAVALPVMTGILGATYMYLHTGKGPDELKDYFFPKTGEKDAQGRDIRLTIPTYMKDVYHYAHDPVGTVEGKVHPAIALMIQMLNNKDYFGREIRHSDDPVVKQMLDEVKYFLSDYLPIGVRQFGQASAAGQSKVEQAGNFIGVTRAPAWIGESSAEQLAAKLASDKYKGSSAPDPKVIADRQRVMIMLRNGNPAEKRQANAQLDKMVQSGEVTTAQRRNLLRGVDHTFLENQVNHLDAREAMRVFAAASVGERQAIRDMVERKILHAHLAPAEREDLLRHFRSLLPKRQINTTLSK